MSAQGEFLRQSATDKSGTEYNDSHPCLNPLLGDTLEVQLRVGRSYGFIPSREEKEPRISSYGSCEEPRSTML